MAFAISFSPPLERFKSFAIPIVYPAEAASIAS